MSAGVKTRAREAGRRVLDPVAAGLSRIGATPNQVTLTGLVLSLGAGAAFAWGEFGVATLLLVLSGLCDVLDGSLARRSGQVSRFGAFFDSTLDRYAEMGVFLGLALLYASSGSALLVGITFAAASGSLLVSYARARAEGLGVECKVGLMERPERVGLLILAGLLGPRVMPAALGVLALLTNATAIQRLLHVYRALRDDRR